MLRFLSPGLTFLKLKFSHTLQSSVLNNLTIDIVDTVKTLGLIGEFSKMDLHIDVVSKHSVLFVCAIR